MKKLTWLPLAAGVLLASGCGKNADIASTDPASASKTAKINNGSELTTPSDPKEVVRLFLDSMRQGNGAQLSSLLSSLAREEIKRKQLEIAPLGSPMATFQIIEAAEQDGGMLVSSTWTEPEQAGQPATELEVVWELRKETEGWRICGMAVDPKNGDDVQIVDFEKLEPEQPAPDPQRVATLPSGPSGYVANANIPASQGNHPQNTTTNQPVGNFPPANNYGQVPSSNLPPASNLPPSNGYQSGGLPPSNFPNNQPANGLPQTNGQFGNQNQPPPIVQGNFAFPPAANSLPPTGQPNQIRR